jgi:hypothetical protein
VALVGLQQHQQQKQMLGEDMQLQARCKDEQRACKGNGSCAGREARCGHATALPGNTRWPSCA